MRYGKKTGLKPSEVLEMASEFFGEAGMGLRVVERTSSLICFEGGGGYVTVTTRTKNGTEVDLETREWDPKVREFMDTI